MPTSQTTFSPPKHIKLSWTKQTNAGCPIKKKLRWSQPLKKKIKKRLRIQLTLKTRQWQPSGTLVAAEEIEVVEEVEANAAEVISAEASVVEVVEVVVAEAEHSDPVTPKP